MVRFKCPTLHLHSTSTVNVPIQVAAAGRKVLYTDCAVMPYANLMVFDDPDPFDDDSEAGWFDVLFGANYVAAMKHLINEPETAELFFEDNVL